MTDSHACAVDISAFYCQVSVVTVPFQYNGLVAVKAEKHETFV